MPDIRYCWSDVTRSYARVLIIHGPSSAGIYLVGFPYGRETKAPPPYHAAHEDRFRVFNDR